jgi:uncharacterized DUF497 family protein
MNPNVKQHSTSGAWISLKLNRFLWVLFLLLRMNVGIMCEQRWVTLGLLREKVVVIVHTESEEEIRIISMREADKDEQLLFFSNFR